MNGKKKRVPFKRDENTQKRHKERRRAAKKVFEAQSSAKRNVNGVLTRSRGHRDRQNEEAGEMNEGGKWWEMDRIH